MEKAHCCLPFGRLEGLVSRCPKRFATVVVGLHSFRRHYGRSPWTRKCQTPWAGFGRSRPGAIPPHRPSRTLFFCHARASPFRSLPYHFSRRAVGTRLEKRRWPASTVTETAWMPLWHPDGVDDRADDGVDDGVDADIATISAEFAAVSQGITRPERIERTPPERRPGEGRSSSLRTPSRLCHSFPIVQFSFSSGEISLSFFVGVVVQPF